MPTAGVDELTDYRLLPAPSHLVPLDSSFVWRSDLIDYSRHPAYSDLVRGAGPAQRLRALATYSGHFLQLLAKRIVRYERIPNDLRSAKTWGGRTRFAAAALRNATGLSSRRNRRPVGEISPLESMMRSNGIVVAIMAPDRFEGLMSQAQPHFDALQARRGRRAGGREFEESRATTVRESAAGLFETIETILQESGLLDAASAYIGRQAKLVDVNPQINDPSDSFWRDIFDDMTERELPQTAYFHRDASGGDLKVIIYCCDVGCENGYFSYAVGSNRMSISALDNLLCEANDHNGLADTKLASRRKFAALPAKLRQKGSFGNDLDDTHPQSRRILESVWCVAGPRGSIVLFDTKGVHRGGMVLEGERRVITCVLG